MHRLAFAALLFGAVLLLPTLSSAKNFITPDDLKMLCAGGPIPGSSAECVRNGLQSDGPTSVVSLFFVTKDFALGYVESRVRKLLEQEKNVGTKFTFITPQELNLVCSSMNSSIARRWCITEKMNDLSIVVISGHFLTTGIRAFIQAHMERLLK